MNKSKLKEELRQLKKTVHIIETLKGVQERYIKRIDALSKLTQTSRIQDQIKTTKKVLSMLKIDEYVEEAHALEEKYMSYINELEPVEKALMLETLINGNPYWKIAMNYGYTEESLRKKIDKNLRKLAASIP